jgi:gas vesicle protein
MGERAVKRDQIIRYRGFGFCHVLLAAFTGAAAGATVAYLAAPGSETDRRRKIRETVDETRETVARVPLALRNATEAAREAFTRTLEQNGHTT